MPPSPNNFRCGYVAIVGWPNVGKSTLLNTLLGMKLSIATPKPQTTRESILGISNKENSQCIFLDTPGWLKPDGVFQAKMRKAINRSVHDDADILVWLIEPRLLMEKDWEFFQTLQKTSKPLIVCVNKADQINDSKLFPQISEQVSSKVGYDVAVLLVSAKTRQGLKELEKEIEKKLPVSPPYFPTDQVTDRWERFYVSELIREQLFGRFHEEVPHACAVVIDEFKEQSGGRKDLVKATIFVETEGQKRIVVGQKGAGIRGVGQAARGEIEKRLGREIYLEINVKIKKNWRKDTQFVQSLHQDFT